MLKIDNNLLLEIGLGGLPDVEKNSLLKHIYDTLEMRVGIRLADQMTNEQLDEFEKYFEAKDDAGAFKWLETNFPNYKDIVQQEFDKLKAEVLQSAPQILAASQQAAAAAPAAQPAVAAPAQPAVAPAPVQQPTAVPPVQPLAPQPQFAAPAPQQSAPVQPAPAPVAAQPFMDPAAMQPQPAPAPMPTPAPAPAPQPMTPPVDTTFPTQQPPAGPAAQ